MSSSSESKVVSRFAVGVVVTQGINRTPKIDKVHRARKRRRKVWRKCDGGGTPRPRKTCSVGEFSHRCRPRCKGVSEENAEERSEQESGGKFGESVTGRAVC